MKVVHVTDADLPARHFNGYDLLDDLATKGVEGTNVVLTKFSDDPRVVALANWSIVPRGSQHLAFGTDSGRLLVAGALVMHAGRTLGYKIDH